ncbi:MAG: phenylalanine--tRNA ligase subunit beta [Acholeplasmatales bacterium]|nr:phenylalanine--tRNA ligase subunit beta [Acholeplasmatales bacterium]
MKVSKNWLGEYLDLSKYSDEELFQEISFHVCEIESYKKMVEATNLSIGKVLECVNHPDSDHLHVCQVEIKPGVVSQIVCGAPNVQAGKKVIVALPGAVLPGNFKIKPSKIRGVESNGMLCSLQELGIEEKYVDEEFKNGIYLFDDDAEVGSDPLKYLGFDDSVIDLEVTSNRSDLLSIEGVAFDVAATLNQKVYPIQPEFEVSDKKNPMSVKVLTDKCYKYNARYLANVKIKPSPLWMKARLIASGIRPINNVVDITNFVLMEMGEPLHAFDANKLGNEIVVRQAYDGEKLVTLDEQERELNSEDIVITDGKEAVCVAGVMGGLSTEVDDNTKDIVLEAAYFDPLSIRKTSTKIGLKSESSTRFERKVDYDRVERALDYACQLMQELADAEIYDGVASDVKVVVEPKYVTITTDKINKVLGTSLIDKEVLDIFDRLAYDYQVNGKEYTIKLPSRRMDLEPSVQDIIEDVARIYGYAKIPTTIAKTRDRGYLTYKQKRTRLIRQILAFMGLNEVVSYSLISERELGYYLEEVKEPVKVLMPMTEDRAVLRESVLNGLIDAIKYNKARKNENLALFEISNVHTKDSEDLHLGIALNGLYSSHLWKGEKQVAGFYLLKGIVEDLFQKLNFKVTYEPYTGIKSFHPGRCAKIIHNGKMVGFLGELHPKFAKENDVSGTVAFEMDLAELISEDNGLKYKPINKFPSIQRDLAIVVNKNVSAEEILTLVRQTGKKYLTKVEVFDVYTGENVKEDEKSIAFTMTFEDSTKTLEAEEIDKVINQILNRLDRELNAKLR